MVEEKCFEQRRFENIENDIVEIKNSITLHSKEIAELREGQAETRVYVKQIFERLDDLKALFKTGANDTSDKWLKVVMELIKAIGIIAGIIAGVKVLGS